MLTKFFKRGVALALFILISSACGTGLSSFTSTPKPIINSPIPTNLPATIAVTADGSQASTCHPVASLGLLPEGGILFSEYDSSQSPAITRVSLWSRNLSSPQPVLEIDSSAKLYLSPNGKKLVWHEYEANHFTVYDLVSKKQEDFPWQAAWQSIRGWRDDETVSILVHYEETYKAGITAEYVYFDLPKQTFVSQVISLNLPGYSRGPNVNKPLDGFAVIDPTESVVIYTGFVDEAKKMILVNRNSGEVLWEHEAPYPSFPPADWTSDGKQVAFAIYDKRPILSTLTADGKTSEIVGEGSSQRIVRDIKWSPDGKYIYYSYWNTIMEGPAFVIDMVTKEMKEICTAGYTFLAGHWLPGDYFAYTVREGEQNDQDGIAEIRIMNTEDWTFQTVFRTTTKVGPTIGFSHNLEILGWTPLSNP